MDLNQLPRKYFEDLQYLDRHEKINIDSIVLLPTRRRDGSGFATYHVIACKGNEVIGKLYGYDTFSIFTKGADRIGIDCLYKSKLMRVFVSPDYYIIPFMHEIEKGDKR